MEFIVNSIFIVLGFINFCAGFTLILGGHLFLGPVALLLSAWLAHLGSKGEINKHDSF